MARFYTNTSPIGNIADGFAEGQKLYQDERYRQALKDITQAENRRAADQFDIEKGGYRKSNFDKAGNYLNRVENAENINRSRPIQKSLDPQSYGREVNPATPDAPDPVAQKELEAYLGKTQEEKEAPVEPVSQDAVNQSYAPAPAVEKPLPERNPQSQGPAPLLRATPGVLQADPGSVELGEEKIVNGKKVIPAKKMALTKEEDVVVDGQQIPQKTIPGTPAVSEEFNPTPEQMALIDKKIFQPTAKDSDYFVDLGKDLDGATKAQLGLDPNATGRIKFSMLKVLADAGLKQKKLEIDDLTYSLADQVKKGSSLGSVLRTFKGSVGREPNEREFDLLTGQAKAGDIDDRFNKNAARLEKEKRNVVVRTLQKDIYTAAKDDIGAIAAAGTLKNLVSKKSTAGFEAVITTMLLKMSGQASNSMSDKDAKAFGGLSGWENQVNAFIAKAKGEGLNPEEKKRVYALADVFIQAAKRNFKNKTSYFRRSAISQMEQYVDSSKEAQEIVDRASDPETLVREFEEPIPSDPKNKGSGSGKNWKPSKDQQVGLMDLQKRTTSKLREIDARPNITPEERSLLKGKVKARFLELTKPYTEDGSGIPWGK